MKMQGIKYAYYYFNIKDPSKCILCGLLTSLLLQLSDHSDGSSSLSNLHTLYRDGSELPDNVSLAGCLKEMLKPPGLGEVQIPTFLILDALDECPNFPGAPPAHKKVLEFLQDLVRSAQPHSNLSICVTSRPEQDILSTLGPLKPNTVSLHDETGQRESIKTFVCSFICDDSTMQRWREEERSLVLTYVEKQTGGM